MSNRIERINSEIQKVLANAIANELKDPRIKGFITVTRVDTTNDLSHCTVYLSIYGVEGQEKQQTFYSLVNCVHFLRKEVAKKVNLRITPELHLKIDDGLSESEKMNKILAGLNIPKGEDVV